MPVTLGSTRAQPRRRGHAPKIEEARLALEREGQLPRNLRPVVRDGLVIDAEAQALKPASVESSAWNGTDIDLATCDPGATRCH